MRLYTSNATRPRSLGVWIALWLLFAVGVIAPVIVAVTDATLISGTSMWPLLKQPCLTFGSRFPFDGSAVRRGDIIAFQTEEHGLLKRVIGMPGETIVISSGNVYVTPVDSKQAYQLVEPYLDDIEPGTFADSGDRRPTFDFYRVPDNHLFVLADERTWGSDSRSFVEDRLFPTPFAPFYAVDSIVSAAWCRDGWIRLGSSPRPSLIPFPAGLIQQSLSWPGSPNVLHGD